MSYSIELIFKHGLWYLWWISAYIKLNNKCLLEEYIHKNLPLILSPKKKEKKKKETKIAQCWDLFADLFSIFHFCHKSMLQIDNEQGFDKGTLYLKKATAYIHEFFVLISYFYS